MSFDLCLPIILASEGGFVNNPQDPGGATNLGVTLNTLSDWYGHAATVDDVRALTVDDVAPLYQVRYWAVAHCDDCPQGLDLMVFDEAVNQGVGRAIRTLQSAVGVADDGAYGPATQAAVKACNPADAINAMAAAREAFYRGLSTFPTFGKGWLARLQRTQAAALGMVSA